jgi:hypothetical protein
VNLDEQKVDAVIDSGNPECVSCVWLSNSTLDAAMASRCDSLPRRGAPAPAAAVPPALFVAPIPPAAKECSPGGHGGSPSKDLLVSQPKSGKDRTSERIWRPVGDVKMASVPIFGSSKRLGRLRERARKFRVIARVRAKSPPGSQPGGGADKMSPTKLAALTLTQPVDAGVRGASQAEGSPSAFRAVSAAAAPSVLEEADGEEEEEGEAAFASASPAPALQSSSDNSVAIMTELAVGVLLHEDDQAAWHDGIVGSPARSPAQYIGGLVSAATLHKHIYHTRDFCYLLRHLRYEMDRAGVRGTFTAAMLLAALRSSYGTSEPHEFAVLAAAFLDACKLSNASFGSDSDGVASHSLPAPSIDGRHTLSGPSAPPPPCGTTVIDSTGGRSVSDVESLIRSHCHDSREITPIALSDFSSATGDTRGLPVLKDSGVMDSIESTQADLRNGATHQLQFNLRCALRHDQRK